MVAVDDTGSYGEEQGMIRGALSGCRSLVNGLTAGTAERARGAVAAVLRSGSARSGQLERLQERVRDLEREVAALRAAADDAVSRRAARSSS